MLLTFPMFHLRPEVGKSEWGLRSQDIHSFDIFSHKRELLFLATSPNGKMKISYISTVLTIPTTYSNSAIHYQQKITLHH